MRPYSFKWFKMPHSMTLARRWFGHESTCERGLGDLSKVLLQERSDQCGDLGQPALQQEVAAVKKIDLRVRQIASERQRAVRPEDLVVAAPHREQRHL